jgi:hypothetical protein
MPILKLTQVIQRPVDVTFAAVVDVANFPKWNPTTKSARKLGEAEFELEIAGFGKTRQTLEEIEPNRHVRLVPHINAISGGHRFTFTPVEGGTRIDHELEMTPKGLFVLMTPFMGMIGKKNLTRTADALKAYLER